MKVLILANIQKKIFLKLDHGWYYKKQISCRIKIVFGKNAKIVDQMPGTVIILLTLHFLFYLHAKSGNDPSTVVVEEDMCRVEPSIQKIGFSRGHWLLSSPIYLQKMGVYFNTAKCFCSLFCFYFFSKI